jgi:tetratricopeptide (TPR) repeat protein
VSLASDAEIPLPETLQAVIASRLDTLSVPHKRLLQDASIVGRVFWSGALATVGGVDEPDVLKGLNQLSGKELVRPARTSSMSEQAEYSFWHALVRDVAYEQIPRVARAAKHVAVAEWIQDIVGDRLTNFAEILAHHHREAMELFLASGSRDQAEELGEKARYFYALAGDQAMRLDIVRAEDHFRRALALAPPEHVDRPGLLLKAGQAAALVRPADARRDYEEAIVACGPQGNRRAGEAMVRLAAVLWLGTGEDRARSQSLVADAIELLEQEAPGPELSLAYLEKSRQLVIGGHFSEGLDWASRTLALADGLTEDSAARARQFRGIARCYLGDVTGGLEDLQEALRLCLELGLGGHETETSYHNLAGMVEVSQGPAKALPVYREAIEFAERRGLIHDARAERVDLLSALFELGQWDECLRGAEEAMAWGEEHRDVWIRSGGLLWKARVMMWRGGNEMASLLQEVLLLAREADVMFYRVGPLVTAACLEWALGHEAEAVGLIEEARQMIQNEPTWFVRGVQDVIRVLVAGGAVDEAQDLFAGRTANMALEQTSLLTAQAILAEARRQPEAALALYTSCTAQWHEYGCVLEEGQGLLGAGRCHLELGHIGEATASLVDARAVFEKLGARPLVEAVDAVLAQASARS